MPGDGLKPLLLAAALFTASVSHALPKDGVVYTVNYPLQYFAEAIAGDDLCEILQRVVDRKDDANLWGRLAP